MTTVATNPIRADAGTAVSSEVQRARCYPLSRWYLRPMAGWAAAALAPTSIRPVHLTFCGLLSAIAAGAVLVWQPEAAPMAAVLVLAYWFFDRADGQLARRQGTVSAWGAWLDGNVDELIDLGLHAAVAGLLAQQAGAAWPWWVLIAFLAGKYLLMYGLTLEEHECGSQAGAWEPGPSPGSQPALLHRMYHLPGNADVRIHCLALALAGNWLAAELALVAAYYNARWIVRYALVFRRLRGVR